MARRRTAARDTVAFLSYVRFDDEYEDGRLTELRKRLESEVRFQTGDEFAIFQDRNDIRWGESWRERIDESLDSVTFLIPIMTPSFFKSTACRAEVERFVEREGRLERTDLILPVYYLKAPVLDDPRRRGRDSVAKLLWEHQYADWRELRFEPSASPELRRATAQLASQLVAALEAVRPARRRTTGTNVVVKSDAQAPKQSTKVVGASARSRRSAPPVSTAEPPTHVVDPEHRGDFTTITEAIAAAAPGDRIRVRPGVYREAIVIDKPLELLGDGEAGDIVVHAEDAPALVFATTIGRVTNLTLRHASPSWYAVDIREGRLDLSACDVTAEHLACVAIGGAADPRLRLNVIHDGAEGGVLFDEGALGTLEDNEIVGAGSSGIEIRAGANPVIRRNRIHRSGEAGIFVNTSGLALIEDNDILESVTSGIYVSEGANPTVRKNRVNRNGYVGAWIDSGGLGTFEENDLRENEQGAWKVDGEPIRRDNLE